jgi:hypothetical protein
VRQEAPTKRELLAALKRARKATLRLIEPVDAGQLVAQVSPIVSGTSSSFSGLVVLTPNARAGRPLAGSDAPISAADPVDRYAHNASPFAPFAFNLNT